MNESQDSPLYTTPAPSSMSESSLVIGIIIVYSGVFACSCFICFYIGVFHFLLNLFKNPLEHNVETAVYQQEHSCVVLGPPQPPSHGELLGIVMVANSNGTES